MVKYKMSLCKSVILAVKQHASGTVPDISQSGITTNLRRCRKCSELINPKSVRERKSTASEREWQLLMAEMYLREDALKAEKD